MDEQNIMTVASLKKLLEEFGSDIGDDFKVWLSSDEEGNEFLPMSKNPELCLAIDKETKRIIFYPLHR